MNRHHHNNSNNYYYYYYYYFAFLSAFNLIDCETKQVSLAVKLSTCSPGEASSIIDWNSGYSDTGFRGFAQFLQTNYGMLSQLADDCLLLNQDTSQITTACVSAGIQPAIFRLRIRSVTDSHVSE
jgi:hypothetical protein